MDPDRGAAVRIATLVAVAAGPGALGPIVAALGSLGVDPSALIDAEQAGLLSLAAGRVVLDPAAAAIYDTATSVERRAVHEALAAALVNDLDRRIWHVAAATELPDAALAQDLEDAASRTADRTHASRMLERAAHLSLSKQDRARRLLDAARVAHLAGTDERAATLLADALASGPDLVLRARIQHEHGRLRLHGDTEGLHAFLVAEAEPVAARDPGLAARMLADAAIVAATNDLDLAHTTIERAAALARGIPDAEPFVELARSSILARTGTATDTEPVLRRILASRTVDQRDLLEAMHRMATVPFWHQDHRAARGLLVTLVASARAAGSSAILPVAMDTLAAIDVQTGHWPRAHRTSSAALRLATELGQTWQAASCLTTLAGIEAARGAEAACRRHLAAALDLGPEDVLLRAYALRAEALLDLGRDAFDDASRTLERLDALLIDGGFASPGVVAFLPDLVEAHARSGRLVDAAAALRRLETQVESGAPPATIAAAARCAGLLADPPTFAGHFEDALRAHDRVETPFERARTELCYGERLRRARRRSDARLHLERAVAAFERLGATPWARRARRELGRDGTSWSGSGPALTAHERQVVSLVVAGATNAEAARALYVSPKTVEHHLSSVYRKLALRSRTELVRRWLDPDGRT